MKIIVTGGDGFVGKNLCRFLRAQKQVSDVISIDMKQGAHFDVSVAGNVRHLADIHGKVDVVIHLAAMPIVNSDSFRLFQNNINATLNVLYLFPTTRHLIVTTDKVLQAKLDQNAYAPYPSWENESFPFAEPYRSSKICCDIISECAAQLTKSDVHTIRFGNIFGPGDFHNSRLIPYTCRQLIHDEPIILRATGSYLRDWIYVKDVCEALWRITGDEYSGGGGPWNIASESHPVSQVVDFLRLIANKPDHEIIVKNQAHNEIHSQTMDTTLFESVMSWTPTYRMYTALKETYEWYQEFYSRNG